MGAQAAVCDVIDVCGKVVSAVSFGDERAHFDVFPSHFFRPYTAAEDAVELVVADGAF